MQNKDEEVPEYHSDDEDNEEQKRPQQNQNNQARIDHGMTSFKDFLLREELMRAIEVCGFEKPSAVQNETINHSVNGRDILCQAQAGTGKTAVFVLSILNQLPKEAPPTSCLVLAPTRELAVQIRDEFKRFGKYLIYKAETLIGGDPIQKSIDKLRDIKPQIVVGTPGRILDMLRGGHLRLNNVKYFVVDECDRMIKEDKMRADVQQIFIKAPKEKQTMMFSGTISREIRDKCVKFQHNPIEIIVEDQSELVLNGLLQYKKDLDEKNKISELVRILDNFEYNQVMIFVNKRDRATVLARELEKRGYPNLFIHGKLTQTERSQSHSEFKEQFRRILVATDLFGRGMDFSRVNMVINFDMPDGDYKEQYLHRVGRAGRQQTKGITISFISSEVERERIKEIQLDMKFEIQDLPTEFTHL